MVLEEGPYVKGVVNKFPLQDLTMLTARHETA
jgi:hypothetical protein